MLYLSLIIFPFLDVYYLLLRMYVRYLYFINIDNFMFNLFLSFNMIFINFLYKLSYFTKIINLYNYYANYRNRLLLKIIMLPYTYYINNKIKPKQNTILNNKKDIDLFLDNLLEY